MQRYFAFLCAFLARVVQFDLFAGFLGILFIASCFRLFFLLAIPARPRGGGDA